MSALRILPIPLGLVVVALALERGDLAPAHAQASRGAEVFSLVAEYVTPTRVDVPLATATASVAVYRVPPGKRLTVRTLALPLGTAGADGQRIAPMGLGETRGDREVEAKTVYFGTGDEPVRLDPGVVFGPDSTVVVRFSRAVTGLAGGLFLNGLLEPAGTR